MAANPGAPTTRPRATGAPGPGVDAQGQPTVDPTANVIRDLEAAVRRLDDLRIAEREFNLAEARHVRELAEVRDKYEERLDEKDGQLRIAESNRIDAIRAVDVGAVNRAAEVSATQATTLAAQVATSAETLRTQVAAAAAAAATALATALEPLNVAIADLRRAQYEAQGVKAQVVESRAVSGGVYAAIGFAVMLLLALLAVASFVIARGGP